MITLDNKGMTLVEVLIGSFMFTVVSLMFTGGLFSVNHLFSAASTGKLMERVADEFILYGDSSPAVQLEDRNITYDLSTLPVNATLTISGDAFNITGTAFRAVLASADRPDDIVTRSSFTFVGVEP